MASEQMETDAEMQQAQNMQQTVADERLRLRRLHEAFKKVLDKTFEEMPFETFIQQFGEEFAALHRDYLFDLYSQLISMTRSNAEVRGDSHTVR
eukprot:1125967-Rhodomonas_salina.2